MKKFVKYSIQSAIEMEFSHAYLFQCIAGAKDLSKLFGECGDKVSGVFIESAENVCRMAPQDCRKVCDILMELKNGVAVNILDEIDRLYTIFDNNASP